MAAVREVRRGGSYLSPRMLFQLVDDFRSRIKSDNLLSLSGALIAREREVLQVLAEGKSVKEIACDLDLSVKTGEAHKFNLMRKLDIHNKAQLVQTRSRKRFSLSPAWTLVTQRGPPARERNRQGVRRDSPPPIRATPRAIATPPRGSRCAPA